MAAKAFGEFLYDLRLERGLTLRRFCQIGGFDPGNVSKVERGRMAPPQSEEKLAEYARALGLEEGSDEWRYFIDLGMASAGQIPPDMLSDEEFVSRIPVLLRTVKGQRLTPEKMDELIDHIKRE